MTGYPQPAEPTCTLSLIILQQKKKKSSGSTQYWLWETIFTASFTSPQYHSLYNPTYLFQHTPFPSEEYAIDLTRMCAHMCVFLCLCLCESWTDSSEPLFLHTSPALIGFGLGTHIPAVLEIHQPWQVYCTTTLHRLWPTTRTKISLSIRKTFMSRDGGGFEMTAATNIRHTKLLI